MVDQVTLKALFLEIFMKANKDSTLSFPITIMLSMLIVGAPYLLRMTLIILSSGDEFD